jgi:hypothetical protein
VVCGGVSAPLMVVHTDMLGECDLHSNLDFVHFVGEFGVFDFRKHAIVAFSS